MITWILLYLGLLLLLYLLHQNDEGAWLRALIIIAYFAIASTVAADYGMTGTIVVGIVGLLVIMKVMNYGLGSAFLLSVGLSVMEYFIRLGVGKYF